MTDGEFAASVTKCAPLGLTRPQSQERAVVSLTPVQRMIVLDDYRVEPSS